MKLGKNSSIEILRSRKNSIFQFIKDKSPVWDASDDKELNSLIDVSDKNKYVFSNSVLDTLHTITIKDEFDCNILHERKTRNGIIIVESNELFIFQEFDGKLKVLNFTVSVKDNHSDIKLFTFNLKDNVKLVDKEIEPQVWKKFLKCLVYLDFLETEIKYINPKGKIGSKKEGKVFNDTDQTIILVTKAWNQEYRTLPGKKFFSSPHWGIRWTGEGRTFPKVTFIKGSFKEINKPAEKEIKR